MLGSWLEIPRVDGMSRPQEPAALAVTPRLRLKQSTARKRSCATWAGEYEVIGNAALNKLLDSIRYELQHLHRKVELQLEIQYSPFRAIGDYVHVRQRLIEAIRGHFPRITEEINQALELIRRESPGNPKVF